MTAKPKTRRWKIMMAIIALISDLINALIQAIGAISPDAAHAIQQALSQAFDFITSLLG